MERIWIAAKSSEIIAEAVNPNSVSIKALLFNIANTFAGVI
jgi:hypothetical protein